MDRHDIETMSQIADRALAKMKIVHKVGKFKKIDLMMDLEYTNDDIKLDFDKFLAFDDFNFFHDMFGIVQNFNRETLQMDNCFVPRCAK